MLEHLYDLAVPPRYRFRGQSAKIYISLIISFQPLRAKWEDFVRIPTAMHVVVTSKNLEGPFFGMIHVLPSLIPSMFTDDAFPSHILKMQDDNIVQVEYRRLCRSGNPGAVNLRPIMLCAVVDEAAWEQRLRYPGGLKTRQDINPAKPQYGPWLCGADSVPVRCALTVRRKRFVRVERDKDSPSRDPACPIDKKTLPM